jgi:hypothetical protein
MNVERSTSLFWFTVSIIVSVASYRPGLGTQGTPGSGFVPFGAAVLLGLLAVALFLREGPGRNPKTTRSLFRDTLWPKAALVLGETIFAMSIFVPGIPLAQGRDKEERRADDRSRTKWAMPSRSPRLKSRHKPDGMR